MCLTYPVSQLFNNSQKYWSHSASLFRLASVPALLDHSGPILESSQSFWRCSLDHFWNILEFCQACLDTRDPFPDISNCWTLVVNIKDEEISDCFPHLSANTLRCAKTRLTFLPQCTEACSVIGKIVKSIRSQCSEACSVTVKIVPRFPSMRRQPVDLNTSGTYRNTPGSSCGINRGGRTVRLHRLSPNGGRPLSHATTNVHFRRLRYSP